jgi:putative ABC transport system permease protein
MRSIRTFLAIFAVATRRLWAKRGLAVASTLGFVIAVALAYTLPLYADSVYQRILNRDLGYNGMQSSRIPAFMFNFRYDTWGDYPSADQFIDTWAERMLKLPRKSTQRLFQTNSFRLFAMKDVTSTQLSRPSLWVPLVSMDQFADHVSFVDGQMADATRMPLPRDAQAGPGGPDVQKVKQLPAIKVLVSKVLADQMGMNIGDRFVLISKQDFRNAVKQPVYISGIWIPRDRYDPYWEEFQAGLMDRMVFLSPDAFITWAPAMRSEIAQASWFMDFDGSSIHVWDVQAFLDRIDALMALLKGQQLPISLGFSPQDKLLAYQAHSRALTTQLYAFSVPVFVLVFAFLVLVAGLMTNSQRNEIAVLRSRGASALQVFGVSFLEACVLGALGAALAAPVSLGIAQVLGQTRSFLTFVGGDWLAVVFTAAIIPAGLAVAGVAVIITALPIIGAARHTIITYKQDQARTLKPPLWQRAGLDLLLFIPVGYWTYLLQKQGTVDVPGIGVPSSDPFSNPALFLVPALAMLALTLLFIRLVPLLLRLLAWVFARLPGVTLVLAMRQLARTPGLYVVPMFLLMLTLALATFTASVASTLDSYLDQKTHYDLGGDVRLIQTGENQQPAGQGGTQSNTSNSGGGQSSGLSLGNIGVLVGDSASTTPAVEPSPTDRGPMYEFLPISDYLKAPQVYAATRVGTYSSVIHFSVGGDVSGHMAGIDRIDFPRVAFWRKDFASQTLGELMNDLASTPEAVLMPQSVMSRHALRVGDRVPVSVYFPGASFQADFKIVGSFNLWPTWYPNREDAGPLLVGNLDYVFQQAQGQFPYDVWVRVKPGANPAAVAPQVRALGQQGYGADDVHTVIENELSRPERQGLFGVLTFGFLAAALLTALGFALYAVFSFRQRYIELGVLRAIGLNSLQMAVFLAWELVVLLISGAVGGAVLGIVTSQVYIPFLQASGENRAIPFLVVINWREITIVYGLFGILFLGVLIGLLASLSRLRIFQAVKLGETQ